MRTFLSSSNNDLALNTAGNLELIQGPGAVADLCRQAMQVRRGECRFDAPRGIPFDSIVWGGSAQVAQFEAAGRQTLAQVSGVARVLSFTAQPDGDVLHYVAEVRTVYGEEIIVNG